MFKLLTFFFLTTFIPKPAGVSDADRICGKWISSDKAIIVLVYKDGNGFKGKMIWYKNTDTSKGMNEWTDKHNPDPALRNRKLLGMDVLNDLSYVPGSDSWENGRVYDSRSGHEYSASVHISKEGLLKVTGYWHFKFLGKTMTFTRA
ncbi:DUF2147 domain-containing protein [Mucilaginibacter sp. UR6-11]|uniref:DUF2147 domain-containing protein n=1 Tax=Mucilaginibacter sp. UR6-11 TaxID=1435644 RepID=UPI001E3629C9|nr:DUF2147 domain-containing protein [Mucilaginibacter sp. UR6-11]MCC8423827.1 DUF2147 domain-containing protein [Mucilaginibacter sp. UR6-11]